MKSKNKVPYLWFEYHKYGDHQTLGGFPKVKEGSSRGFDGK